MPYTQRRQYRSTSEKKLSTNLEILQMVRDYAGDSSVEADTPFDTLRIDSLEFVALLQEVEELTGVHIADEHVAQLKTPGDLIDYVNQRTPITDHVSS